MTKKAAARTAPAPEPEPGPPTRSSRQRSATTTGNHEGTLAENERFITEDATPAASERIMGLPDSPRAAETHTGL